jgi:hypothetical protein
MGAMQSSGAISISQVETQFGGSASTSFSEYYRGGTYVPTAATSSSGIPTPGNAISLSNFYSAQPHGESVYTTPGTYTWTCPPGVTSVYVVCIGGGASGDGYYESTYYCTSCPDYPHCVTYGFYNQNGGGGGGLAYKTISVSPGTNYTVQVGSGGVYAIYSGSGGGGLSWFQANGVVTGGGGYGRNGGSYTGDGGGNGGYGGYQPYTNGRGGGGGTTVQTFSGGGGGAGGYSGAGGNGMSDVSLDTSTYGPYNDSSFAGSYGVSGGSGGGGGGGGYSTRGGGVGVYGSGSSGAAGSASLYYGGRQGNLHYSYPGGLNSASAGGDGSGGSYGYGGYGTIGNSPGSTNALSGGGGAVRITW